MDENQTVETQNHGISPEWQAQFDRYDHILSIDDFRLKRACQPVDDEYLDSGEIFPLIVMMRNWMIAKNGIGIAANQVGGDRRVIIVRDAVNRDLFHTLINPVIFSRSGKMDTSERCLSVDDGKSAYLCSRAVRVRVRFLTPQQTGDNTCNFPETTLVADGLDAAVIQHEIDHLNGRNITQVGKYMEPDGDNRIAESLTG